MSPWRIVAAWRTGKLPLSCPQLAEIVDDLDDLERAIRSYRAGRRRSDPIGGLTHRIRIDREETKALYGALGKHLEKCKKCGALQ